MYVSIYRCNIESVDDIWNNMGRGGRDNPYGRAQARHNIDYQAALAMQQQQLADLEDWYQEQLALIKVGRNKKFKTRNELDLAYDLKKEDIEEKYRIALVRADSKRDRDIKQNSSNWDAIKYWGGKAAQAGAVMGAAYGADRLLANKDGGSSMLGSIASTTIAVRGGEAMRSKY